MEVKLKLTDQERLEFRNVKMLKSIYNSLMKHNKKLLEDIETSNNFLVSRLNKKYGITLEHDYVYDEIEGDLKHCLSHQHHIENILVVNKGCPDLLDQAMGGLFEPLLRTMVKEYGEIEKARMSVKGGHNG